MELVQCASAHLFSFGTLIISIHGSSPASIGSELHPESRLSPFSDELSSPVDPPCLVGSPALPVPVTPVPSAKARGKRKTTAPKDIQ